MLCSPLRSLLLTHVRFESTPLNVKYYFISEVFEQADVVGRTATCYKVQITGQQSPAAKGDKREMEQP